LPFASQQQLPKLLFVNNKASEPADHRRLKILIGRTKLTGALALLGAHIEDREMCVMKVRLSSTQHLLLQTDH
jgi:hypothetical protein